MRIILDAMGGDNAPDAVIGGALRAAKELDIELVLIGRGAEILKALEHQGAATLPKGMEVANAEDVVEMHDDPAKVVRTRRDSSMVLGLQMIAEGQGDAFVSAGSTGALLSAATLVVKRIKGVRRAAFAPILPTAVGKCVLIDSGANAECTPEFLCQFACMGSLFAKKTLGIAEPRVGLLNIGAEEGKGSVLQKETYPLLREMDSANLIHFTGNVEARDVPLGGADVVVADGFSGNVLLKGIEGTAMFMSKQLKGIFMKNALTKAAALLCKPGVNALKDLMDYRKVGGTPLLGIRKPVVKAHGSSDELAFFHAIRQAVGAVEADLAGSLRENLDKMNVGRERSHAE